MMIDFRDIITKYGIEPKGVLQVGAHWAEEHDYYLEMGVRKFVYVEPCKPAFDVLINKFMASNNPDVQIYNVACGATMDIMPMYVSHNNEGQSNSILKPKLHLDQHPEIQFNDAEAVQMVTLDSLPIKKEDYNILVMDVQGYEGEVLKGADEVLKQVEIVYTEVNRGQTYEGNMEIEELDEFLSRYGFNRVETFWPSPNLTWGDAAYVLRKS